MKKLPAPTVNTEIKIKDDPKTETIKKAPDEVIARAIRDAMLKERKR